MRSGTLRAGAAASVNLRTLRLERSIVNDPVSGGAAMPARRTRDRESERILAGIGLVIVAIACFATLDTTTKLSTGACRS